LNYVIKRGGGNGPDETRQPVEIPRCQYPQGQTLDDEEIKNRSSSRSFFLYKSSIVWIAIGEGGKK